MLVVLVLAAALLLGCTQPQGNTGGTQAPGGAGTAGPSGGSTAPSGAANATVGTGATGGTGGVAGGVTAGGATGGAGTGGTGATGAGTGGGADITAVTSYAAAIALGLPMVCTVSAGGQAYTISVKGQNLYMEGSSGGQPFVAVEKNGQVYLQLTTAMKSSFAQLGKNCDWLVYDTASSTGTSETTADVTAVEQADAQWSCAPGAFGDEKFNTPGGQCTMNDLVPSGAGAGGTVPNY